MQAKLQRLRKLLGTVHDLGRAVAILEWDLETKMPPGGAQARAQQLATLEGLQHQHFISDEIGQLLEDLSDYEDQLDFNSDDASLLRVTRREYERKVKVPTDLVERIAEATGIGRVAWASARDESDFAKFAPHLDEIIKLKREWGAHFEGHDNPYDPLFDAYEPGMKSAEAGEVLSALRPHLVELSAQINQNQDAVSDALLRQHFDHQEQLDFSVELAKALGYEFERGRQDLTAHPFCTTFAIDDVRITTRVDLEFPAQCWFGTMHESGHAIHAQGNRQALGRTPLADNYGSLGIGESQSRLYENLIGRSRAFWQHFLPIAQQRFPSQLGAASLDDFYKAINNSQASLVRVEADEVTYGLHIIVRFEIEQIMMRGDVEAAGLPELWNSKMEEYLGLTPPNDREGVLQDIHWSVGYIGYFATYLLGSIFSVQLWEQMKGDLGDLNDRMAQGQFTEIREWLREHVHAHGDKFGLQEMAQLETGRPLDSGPYISYLNEKYSDIYGL